MADPRWRTTISNFNFFVSYCFFSLYKCFLVTISYESLTKKMTLPIVLLFYVSKWKIIRNIEKSEYDVTVTSSLGMATENWVGGCFVRR